MQLDAGRPDDRVIVADASTITVINPTTAPANGRPGYVWNNGHWERAKANGTSVSTPGGPLNATVEKRDHQSLGTPTTGSSGHGGYGPYGYGVTPSPVGNNGSVQVSNTVPVELTGQTIYGSGIGIGDLIKIHNPKTIIDHLPPYGFEAVANPRDHRKPPKRGSKNQR